MSEGAAGEGFEDECESEDGEGEREARGGGVEAEELEAGGHGPVEERGFFEVADAVGVEGDPVVAEEHLAGDFGVDGVGVVEEWRGEEGEAGVEEEPESEEDEAVAAYRGSGVGSREQCMRASASIRGEYSMRRLTQMSTGMHR